MVGAIVLLCTMSTTALPQPGEDVPYLLLGEALEGKRLTAEEGFLHEDGSVRSMHGLLSDNYWTQEGFRAEDGEEYYLWQECYDLRFGDLLARDLADSLLANTAFCRSGEIEEFPFQGFDYAVSCPGAVAAVRGDRVYCLSGSTILMDEDLQKTLLAALLEKPM